MCTIASGDVLAKKGFSRPLAAVASLQMEEETVVLSLRGSEVQPSLQSGSEVAMVLQVCMSAWRGGRCRRMSEGPVSPLG